MSNTNDQLVADYLRRLAAAAASLPADRRDELMEEISAHIAEARAVGPDATAEGELRTAVADTLARLGDPDDIVRAAAEQAGGGQFGGPADPGGEPVAGPASTGGFGDADRHGPGDAGGFGPGGGYPGWPASYEPSRPIESGMGALEIASVILLLVGGFLAGIGWIVGVVLLWISPRWRLSDKLLGTLVWPGGLAGALIVLSGGALFAVGSVSAVCSSGGIASSGSASSSGSDQTSSQNCSNAGAALPGWLTVTLLIVAVVLAIGGPILVTIRLVRQARREQQAYAATA